jgi:monofunctional biosynthetic peptidoglycan transglycosylase
MYFSKDVSVLQIEYPHVTFKKPDQVVVEIKKNKPKYWVELRSISPYARGAIVLSEDWAFFDHEGVDVEQMKVALSEMVDEGKFRGASTITQQMVKNVFLSSSRTIWRKIHEIILAHKVDRLLSKNKILEIYLNSIEYGPGLYGIKAASQHYFKKLPSEIGPKESAFLAMLLPSPKRYYVSFSKKRLTKFANSRIKAILKKMRMGKVITAEQYDYELANPLSWEK